MYLILLLLKIGRCFAFWEYERGFFWGGITCFLADVRSVVGGVKVSDTGTDW